MRGGSIVVVCGGGTWWWYVVVVVCESSGGGVFCMPSVYVYGFLIYQRSCNNFYMFCSQCFSFTVVMVIVFNYVWLGKFLLIASRFDMTCVILALFVHLQRWYGCICAFVLVILYFHLSEPLYVHFHQVYAKLL